MIIGILLTCLTLLAYGLLIRFRIKAASQYGYKVNWFLQAALSLAIAQAIFFTYFAIFELRTVEQKQHETGRIDEITLFVDVSDSMLVRDGKTDESRLQRAKNIAMKLVEKYPEIPVSLFAFAGTTEQIVPATFDTAYLHFFIDSLTPKSVDLPGTNFEALFSAMEKYVADNPYKKHIAALLLTDGEESAASTQAQLLQTASECAQNGISFFTVGIGSAQGAVVPGTSHVSKLDSQFLEKLTQRTNGRLFLEENYSAPALVDACNKELKKQQAAHLTPQPNELFPTISILCALFFLLLALFIPKTRRLVALLPILFVPYTYAETDVAIDRAFSYFNSDYYELARETFQASFQNSYDPIVRARLQCMIALCYAYENAFDDAVQTFHEIDASQLPSTEEKEHYLYNYVLALCKNIEKKVTEAECGRASADIALAKKLLLQLPETQSEQLHEELALAQMQVLKCQELHEKIAYLATLRDFLVDHHAEIDVDAVLSNLQWLGISVKKTASPVADTLDDLVCRERVAQPNIDPCEEALKLVMEAKESYAATPIPFWKNRIQKRLAIAREVIAASQKSPEEKKRLLDFLDHFSVEEVLTYLLSLNLPLNSVFEMAVTNKESSALLPEAIKKRVGNDAAAYLQSTATSQDALVSAWAITFPHECFDYLLRQVQARKEMANYFVTAITAATKAHILEETPELQDGLARVSSQSDKRSAVAALAFSIDSQLNPGNKNFILNARMAQEALLFEKIILQNNELEPYTLAISLRHLATLSNMVDNEKVHNEIQALIMLQQSMGEQPNMVRYFHERAASVLEQVIESLQKEIPPPATPTSAAAEQLATKQNILFTIREMQEDDKEEEKTGRKQEGASW